MRSWERGRTCDRGFLLRSPAIGEGRQTQQEAAAAGAQVPRPPTEQDYEALVLDVFTAGMTEDQFQAVVNQDAEHPEFCSGLIRWMDGLIAMEGPAGEAVRFETTQGMLSFAP